MADSEHKAWSFRFVRLSVGASVLYLVGSALLTMSYPSVRFAEPIPFGPNMFASETNEQYNGRLLATGWPIRFYMARTEPPEPNTQGPQILVTRRFSMIALAADLAAVIAVVGIVVTLKGTPADQRFSVKWFAGVLACVVVLIAVSVASTCSFLEPIPLYAP